MNDCPGENLFWRTVHHANVVASVKTLRQDVASGAQDCEKLAQAVAEEELARNEIIHWRPATVRDAQVKLIYLVYFLAITKGSFDTATMAKIQETVDHLRQHGGMTRSSLAGCRVPILKNGNCLEERDDR
ncbi:hypothetical protein LJR255_004084 [Pararhizobium sp. LjRoot255]|uniref:hypothetical protein n=1 Tax=Pararhizobium sp. LjRoot255 TaxID=3342298 RepID=UPI003ECDBE61